MYYHLCLILVLCSPALASEKWRDPHEMEIDMPRSRIRDAEVACQRQDAEIKSIRIFYKRAIASLTQYVTVSRQDDSIYDFNLRISIKDYKELKEAVDGLTNFDYDRLRQIEAILSRVKGKSYKQWLREEALSWSEYVKMNWFTKEAAVIFFISMLPVLIYCYQKATMQTIIMIIMFVIWAADFGLTWFNKYEDLEVDHLVDMSRYQSSAPTCDLTQMYFWQRWFSSLSPTEECRRYYSAKYRNRNYQIGPYDIIIEQAGKIMKIFRFVGIEISKFLSIVTMDIMWPLNWVVMILLIIGGFYILQLVLFIMFGYSFRINIAHLFNFEIKNDHNPRAVRENREFIKMIEEVKQIPIHMAESVRKIADVIRANEATPTVVAASADQGLMTNAAIAASVSATTQTEAAQAPEEDFVQSKPSTSSMKLTTDQLINEETGNTLPEVIEENEDKEESSSESIEVVGDTNRIYDFLGYVLVNEGDGIKHLDID